jgi:hypothetical protein
VREDEHVEAPGSVVVHGDVLADASIEAAGDVMVWGRSAALHEAKLVKRLIAVLLPIHKAAYC